jgi:hypothetical protein
VLQGDGLPATGEFNIDQINVGHVYLGDVLNYSVTLRNSGELPFDFSLVPRTLPDLVFRFSPSGGHLSPRESREVVVTFEATRVGQFNETFEYQIEGGEGRGNPTITLYGRVVGSSFRISPDVVDFGTVSVGFLYAREFLLENVTEIPFDFHFALEHSNTFESREFVITPNEGTLGKLGKQKVRIEFIPISLQTYHVNLLLDSPRFGERLAVVPMQALCFCPDVSIVNTLVECGPLFINHEHTEDLLMRNATLFPAKFEFIDVDDESTLDAKVTVGKYRGVVVANRDSPLPIFIRPLQLGELDILRHIRIFGSAAEPLPFRIKGTCVGPNIRFSSQKIDFGAIKVLNEAKSVLDLFNDSLIPAFYHSTIQSDKNIFRIAKTDGEIAPGETDHLEIMAFLDDTIAFSGKLSLFFHYLSPKALDISAKGTGTALVSSIDMNEINFDHMFTCEPATRTFTLENKGRRPQEVKWNRAKAQLE